LAHETRFFVFGRRFRAGRKLHFFDRQLQIPYAKDIVAHNFNFVSRLSFKWGPAITANLAFLQEFLNKKKNS